MPGAGCQKIKNPPRIFPGRCCKSRIQVARNFVAASRKWEHCSWLQSIRIRIGIVGSRETIPIRLFALTHWVSLPAMIRKGCTVAMPTNSTRSSKEEKETWNSRMIFHSKLYKSVFIMYNDPVSGVPTGTYYNIDFSKIKIAVWMKRTKNINHFWVKIT